MLEVNSRQVRDTLAAVGVQRGDGLLVHSAVQFLGRPEGGVGMYLEALQETLGPEGTIAVPAFNFGFARGERYDPGTTPSIGMGVFSEHVRGHASARRTPHPMQSLAVLGRYADDLAERDTASAFDPGSPFERMLELGFKILLLGADVDAISMLHYSEQRHAVPYRYWKEFTSEVHTQTGWQTRTYRMFVRDLDIDPQLTLKSVQEHLETKGQWVSVALNYGSVSMCLMRDFVSAVDSLLSEDPWSLATNRLDADKRRSRG